MGKHQKMVREAVGVMEDVASLELAVDELLAAGFQKDDISLLASLEAVEERMGRLYQRVEELEDDPSAPRTAFESTRSVNRREDWVVGSLTTLPTLLAAGTVVASAGIVAAAIAGTAVTGALIGTVLANWMDRHHAQWLQDQLDRGGILLWVRAADSEREQKAMKILKRHAAHDVHVHEIPDPR